MESVEGTVIVEEGTAAAAAADTSEPSKNVMDDETRVPSSDGDEGEMERPCDQDQGDNSQGNNSHGNTSQVNGENSRIEMSLDRLLQRQRSEIMFELRRLQYGDRPVSGQEDRRRAVERLVCRATRPTNVPRGNHRTDRLSSSSAGEEQHRPEEILVEVNALVERRPVSSMLQSLAFRRSLENSVRGILRNLRGDTAASSAGTAGQRGVSNSPSSSDSRRQYTPRGAVGPVRQEVLERRRPSEDYITDNEIDNHRQPESPPQESNPLPSASQSAAAETEPSVVDPSFPVASGSTRAQEWLQQHVPVLVDTGDVRRNMRSWELMEQIHHEDFVMEISDLIQRQLVTSSLNGNFRNVLERRLRRHVETSGIDGGRVAEQLRQLPRSTFHRRNDFFDLGIMTAPVGGGGTGGSSQDQLDNVSVISAAAAVALPQAYTQSNAAISREIHSMKTELQELKSLIRLNFDLQLDIQRSIRQEVSAAMATAATGGASLSVQPIVPAVNDVGRGGGGGGGGGSAADGQCLICLDQQVDTVLYQCGHMCLCYACGMRLRQNGAHCPVCRASIRDIIRTYRS